MKRITAATFAGFILALVSSAALGAPPAPVCISGVYPHLGVLGGDECGIGTLVPFAGKLWFNWYGSGGGGELYSVDDALGLKCHLRGVSGLGDRMIHPETNQLFISGCVVDANGNARKLEGCRFRCTAVARHLTDPANKVFLYGMEGHLAEVDVHTGKGTILCRVQDKGVTGAHGKGGYSGQGRLVVANNGGRGGLAEWDGKADKWTLLEEKQFTDVTSPGGIRGPAADDPLWTVGWDAKSVILKVCDKGRWHTYRLPKASYTHDAGHGWFTEWPRIRETAGGRFLLDHHGMFYDFPKDFRPGRTGGLRPIATHLRMVSDWCTWNGRLVMCHDDASVLSSGGLTTQSQSNLWFGSEEELRSFGKPAGWGGPWVNDEVKAGEFSDPMLVAGFEKRVLHLGNKGKADATFTLQVDVEGDGRWKDYRQVKVPAAGYAYHIFPPDFRGQWARLKSDVDCTAVAYFHFSSSGGPADGKERAEMFASLATAGKAEPRCEGTMLHRAKSEMLDFAAVGVDAQGAAADVGHYEMNMRMEMRPGEAPNAKAPASRPARAAKPGRTGSDADGYLLPGFEADSPYAAAAAKGWRGRETRTVITERSLGNVDGTFYEVPHSGGIRRARPVATHGRMISDYCCWRGLLVLAGTRAGARSDGHYFASGDGKAGLWFGKFDDLWQMGKPRGLGGPWKRTAIRADEPSAAYMMTNYDRKTLELSHDARTDVTFTVEVDVLAAGAWWATYATLKAPAGQTVRHEFPDGYSAHWVRLRGDTACNATAQFTYR
jgi:hypothetical protein